MSLNRVIARPARIPWHLPEDFKWFKKRRWATSSSWDARRLKAGPAAAQPEESDPDAASAAASSKVIAKFSGHISRVARRPLSQARLQFHFSKLEKDQKTDRADFQLAGAAGSVGIPHEIFICGGADIYAQMLPRCSDLYLTRSNARWKATRFSRRLKTGSCWLKKSATRRSSKSCITGTAH